MIFASLLHFDIASWLQKTVLHELSTTKVALVFLLTPADMYIYSTFTMINVLVVSYITVINVTYSDMHVHVWRWRY